MSLAKNVTPASINNDGCKWTECPIWDSVWQLLNYWQTKSKLASISMGPPLSFRCSKTHSGSSEAKWAASAAQWSAYREVMPEDAPTTVWERICFAAQLDYDWMKRAWTLITAYTLAVCDCVLKQLRIHKGRLGRRSTPPQRLANINHHNTLI